MLDYLRDRDARGQHPPSLTEICHDLGLVSRGSLHKQIVALVDAGLVEPMHGKQRGVRLVRAQHDERPVPLLGSIAAGRPLEALTRDETVDVPGWLLRGGACYALRVRGDSMRDAGILDGDLLAVQKASDAKNGQIVVARLGDEVTVKRLRRTKQGIELIPENPEFEILRVNPGSAEFALEGLAVGLIRNTMLT